MPISVMEIDGMPLSRRVIDMHAIGVAVPAASVREDDEMSEKAVTSDIRSMAATAINEMTAISHIIRMLIVIIEIVAIVKTIESAEDRVTGEGSCSVRL
jgi:hypothetical protein